ncbi:STAS domain-containing protein [Hymenobacter terrenus]|uniref:STAS domain-containing protein n=1 Tax=Hymenobacter terrenus TaxID=1629124 RepID=UPI0018CFD0F2|nr:STAS domain-containing protein [Hymenobacter terrenus]
MARTAQLWIDCQQLQSLSVLGQRALLQADTRARAAGTVCYWCGMSAYVLAQLAESGVQNVLTLLPAEDFQGPTFLLPST